jgi:MoxR-like ATPase
MATASKSVTVGQITLPVHKPAKALAPLVPAVEEFTGFADPMGLMEQMFWAIREGEDILLKGATGTGKTHLARAVASALRAPYFRFPCNEGTDATQLLGKLLYQGSSKPMVWQDGKATTWARHGGVLVLDEYNQAHADSRIVLAPVHASDERKLYVEDNGSEVIDRADNGILIGTWNPYEYVGTKEWGAQLMSRFGVVIDVDYLPASDERELLVKQVPSIPAMTAEKMVAAANLVRAAQDDERVQFPMSYREIKTWAKATEVYGVAKAAQIAVLGKVTDDLEREAIEVTLSTPFDEQEWV